MTVSNQTTEKINAKINRTAVVGMFNPRDVLELVNNSLDNRTLTG
ncbi:putative transposase domain protein [Microcystis aeruginosa TAIHU98]|uniref:Putative transposase domain protein n=1 Tax=Microcystis aeruginosa TAIHU98 TaxID=1134457 RepID=L7E7I3_MICAE|nr:putative transposase domain protein [Microcystis aeruginosa TAIHU98]